MTRVTKPKRGGRPTKRLDLGDIREALKDHRQWSAMGVVSKPEDGGQHYEIVGNNADVMIEVVLVPDHVRVIARLAAGMWIVPDVGDEVAVLLPAGELDFMPVITCILSHALPSAQGPAPNRIVIARGEVLIHDGEGGASELVKRSEFLSHGHPIIATGATTPCAGPVTGAAPAGSSSLFPGTTVLKAK